MENASKALIIAGAVLIAILVISLGVLIFKNFSSTAKQAANMDEQEVEEFNADILPYVGTTVSGSQVNALIQLVYSIDSSSISEGDAKNVTLIYDNGTTRQTLVTVNGERVDRAETRRVETGSSKYYTVTIQKYNDLGLISEILVTEVSPSGT